MAQSEFSRGWQILALGIAGIIASAGYLPLYSFGPIVKDASASLGATPGELQRCITFSFIGLVLGAQGAGWLNRRFGIRVVTLVSLPALAALFVLLSLVPLSTNLLYLFYFLMPLVGVGTLQVSWTHLICEWFVKHRGLALAIVLSGSGLCSALVPLILANHPGGDWQAGFLYLAGLPLLCFALAWFWLRERQPHPAAGVSSGSAADGVTAPYAEVLRSRYFWLIAVPIAMAMVGLLPMITNIVPLLEERGLDSGLAAAVFGAFGVGLISGRLVVGYLNDLLWAPGVGFASMSLPALGCLMFLFAPDATALMVLATFLVGAGAGAENDVISYLCSRYFRLEAYGRVFGLAFGVATLASGIGPLVFGALLDRGAGYALPVQVSAGLIFAGSAALLLLGRYPRHE